MVIRIALIYVNSVNECVTNMNELRICVFIKSILNTASVENSLDKRKKLLVKMAVSFLTPNQKQNNVTIIKKQHVNIT